MDEIDIKKKKKRTRRIWIIMTAIIVFLGLNIIGMVVATPIIYDSIFPKVNSVDTSITPGLIDYSYIEKDYPRKKVTFTSEENKLNGYYYEVDNPLGLIIFSHGMSSGADSYLSLLTYFIDNSYSIFSYDSTGTYESEGDSLKGFPEQTIDLYSAIKYVDSQDDMKDLPKFLLGHSWGGYAVSTVLNVYSDIQAIASISGADSAEEIVINFARDKVSFLADISSPFVLAYQKLKFNEFASYTGVNGINKSNVPSFIAHGEDDTRFLLERDSLIRKFDKLTFNNNVKYLSAGITGGHSSILYSESANEYQKKVKEDYNDYLDSLNGAITYEQKQSFYASVNNKLYSEINLDLASSILEFFGKY